MLQRDPYSFKKHLNGLSKAKGWVIQISQVPSALHDLPVVISSSFSFSVRFFQSS
jgi:hypothetical protein